MPWLAMPFSDSETRMHLKRLFNIYRFPKLVIVDVNGNANEATDIVWDYEAEASPFTSERINFLKNTEREASQTLLSLLDSTNYLVSQDGNKVLTQNQLFGVC